MLDTVTSLQVNGMTTIVVASVMTGLTTVAVALRLSTKYLVNAKFGMSEALLVLMQILWYIQYAIQIWALVLGRRIKEPTDPRLVDYMRLAYINGELYAPDVMLCNFSILFLYRRLFPIQSFKRATVYVMVAHVVWFIPAFVTETMLCNPPSIVWAHMELIPSKCIFYSTFFIITMSFELLLDVAILALPVFYVSQLKLPWERRAELMFCFLLGGLVIITGIVRICKAATAGIQVIDFVLDILWADVHVGVAIICACLPTYRPLVLKASSVVSGSVRKVFSSGSSSTWGSSGLKGSDNSTPKGGEVLEGHWEMTPTSPEFKQDKEYKGFGSTDQVPLTGAAALV